MIVEKHISIWRLIPIIWKRMVVMTLLSSSIIIPIVAFELNEFTIDMTTPLILGTAISIFLGFRTNSAYDRWFRARGLWGSLRASSRNLALILARQNENYTNLKTGKPSKKAEIILPRMIKRVLAWTWVLNKQLKDESPLNKEVEDLLDPDEYEALKHVHNPALKLLFNQSRDFRMAMDEGQFCDGEHFEIVAIQRELVASQTQCEGLKNTPFPTHYTYFTDLFVWLLVVLLSFSLPQVENSGYFAIPLVVFIGWTFSMVEGIGNYMDEPFINNRNVVPMDALARNLEIDLRAFGLGEIELPAPIKPVKGALY